MCLPCGPVQAQKQNQAQQAAEEACHLDASAQRLQAEVQMVASNTQAAAAAASRAQGAPQPEPQLYSSQPAARSMAMMRPSPAPHHHQQQQQQASCQPMLFAPAPVQQRHGGPVEGVQQSQQRLESMYLHQAQQAPTSRVQQQQQEKAQQQHALGLAGVAVQHSELEDIDDDGALAWAAEDIREEESKKFAAAAAESASKARIDQQRQPPPRQPEPPAQHQQQQAVPLPTPPGYRGVTRHRSFVHERGPDPFVRGLERAASFPGAQQHEAVQQEVAPPARGAPPAMLQYRQGNSSLCQPAMAGSGSKAPNRAAQASQPMLVFQPATSGTSHDAHLEVGRLSWSLLHGQPHVSKRAMYTSGVQLSAH